MHTEIYKKGDSIMKKIYDALDIIKEYLGTEVYEVCLLGEKGLYERFANGCMGEHCKNCRNLWKTRLSYNNLSEIGKSIFFTKEEAKKVLEDAGIKIYE